MDSNIKQEMIDGINQLHIKEEDGLSKAAKMPAVSKVAIEISEDFDVQVLDDGIEASPHIYLYHHPEVANRIYSAKNVTGSKTQVIVKELNLGTDERPKYVKITFEFDNFHGAHNFVNELDKRGYTYQEKL